MIQQRGSNDRCDLASTDLARSLHEINFRGADWVRNDPLREAIEALELGLVVAAASGRVILANAVARNLIRQREGLAASCRGLAVITYNRAVPLADLLARSNTLAQVATDGLLPLHRGGSRPPLFAHIVRLRLPDAEPDETHLPAVALLVIDLNRYTRARLATFVTLHHLTPAEKRALEQVVSGKGIVEAAPRLGVGETTLRTHLHRIFDKTGTSRQTQLLSLLFGTLPQGASD